MFTMPRYEVKYKENEEWKEISELELIDGLYKLYHRISPAIKELIEGKELHTAEAFYRLKWRFGKPQTTGGNPDHVFPVV